MDRQPLTPGRMGFWPDRGLPAYAPIQSDGSYRLTTFKAGDGAMPGMGESPVRLDHAVS